MNQPQTNWVSGVAFKATGSVNTDTDYGYTDLLVPGLRAGDLVVFSETDDVNTISLSKTIVSEGTVRAYYYTLGPVNTSVTFSGLMFRPENPLETNVFC